MPSEREQDDAMDLQRAVRIARNRKSLRAVEENERAQKKTGSHVGAAEGERAGLAR